MNDQSSGNVVSHPSAAALRERAIASAVEARAVWRHGFDAGRSAAIDDVLNGDCIGRRALEQIAFELNLLRAVAVDLGAQVDYWRERADEMELEAARWHTIAARAGEALQ